MTSSASRPHDNIPAELRETPQWVCSREDGVPISPRTGRKAKSNDPRTWGTFDEARAACANYGYDHIAFALTADDPYCAVDLDDKADNPANAATLALFDTIIDGLDSYTERSRSGRGLHVVVKAKIAAPLKKAHVEVYDRGHFMTFTGDTVGTPKPISERTDRISKIVASLRPSKSATTKELVASVSQEPDDVVLQRAANNPTMGAKFAALHAGEWESLYASQSEADLAYFGVLWNACGNAQQVERLWLASALAQRAKGQRPDYIAGMLAKVSQSPAKLYSEDDPASPFSDTSNARRIVRHMGSYLLFVPGIGWHVWDGARWRCDVLEAHRHVAKIGRIIAKEAGDLLAKDQSQYARDLAEALVKFAGRSENVPKIDAAMRASEPLLRCNADKLDADPWLLGCTNGLVDLRTGQLLPATSEQLISKSAGHAFEPNATCPTWDSFLARIFRKQPDLPPFMQRLAGFWLTGLTDPPYLAVLYGVGANGKSTFVSALSHAMGEYASAAPPGLLMTRSGQQHPTEVAFLHGKRLVVAAETAEGGKLNEERIKALTGSDPITARHLYQNFYTFLPTHSFALMTNHKPIVAGTDEGIWRRLLLIPFSEVIPEAERDPLLTAKLRNEASGILRWAVEGARQFARTATLLPLPRAVADATRAYRTESDVLGEFIAEECDEGAKLSVATSVLYGKYESWCVECGEQPCSKRALGLRLQDRGYARKKDRRSQRLWVGLALKQQPKFYR